MLTNNDYKLAIISDQLAGGIGGAESVLFALYELFPDAPTYTTVYNQAIMPDKYKDKEIISSYIQNLPLSKKLYKAYFPLMPSAVEYFDLQKYDILFSSHHCVAKGIIPRPDAVHLCYCHSPARYIWDMFWTYAELNNLSPLKKIVTSIISNYIRMWDVTSSCRVDHYLANSSYTAKRIKKFYNRESLILHPPVDINKFKNEETDDYYLMVGRLVAYKGFELAVEAFNESGKKLIIVGKGAEYYKLKEKANSNIVMTGKVSDEDLVKFMNNCKGFVFPGKEDFGIVMAEAQSAGKPVIAFKAGGALDIVKDNETGVLFEQQSVQSLNEAINKSESINWDADLIRNHSKQFDSNLFKEKVNFLINNAFELEELIKNNGKELIYSIPNNENRVQVNL
ncbi:MAG: glycosyltransferase [bacterium]